MLSTLPTVVHFRIDHHSHVKLYCNCVKEISIIKDSRVTRYPFQNQKGLDFPHLTTPAKQKLIGTGGCHFYFQKIFVLSLSQSR